MFRGFQNTGKSIITFSPSNMFSGFAATQFSENTLPIVTTGIEAWWTSQSGITLSGSNVTSWVDLIGGYNLQPTTSQPTYNAANPLYRAYPTLGFTSSQNLLAGNILNIGTNAGLTIVAVVNLTGSSATFLSKSSNASDQTAGTWSLQYYTGSIYFTYGKGVGYAQVLTNFTPPATAVITGIIDRTNGLIWCYVNYVSVSGTTPATLTNVTPVFPLGINAVSGSSGVATVMEIIMYNQALSQTQVNQNVAYLKSKYGIS